MEGSMRGTKRPASDPAAAGSAGSPATRKDPKTEESKGEKRTAEISVEELFEANLEGGLPVKELVFAWPTLHDQPVAAYAEWGRLLHGEVAYDEEKGQPLPRDKVVRARGRELDKMDERQVKEDITWEQVQQRGLKVAKSRWVDGWTPLPDDPDGVRSRCVAQEINHTPRDDVYSGAPPLKASHGSVFCSYEKKRKPRTSEAHSAI